MIVPNDVHEETDHYVLETNPHSAKGVPVKGAPFNFLETHGRRQEKAFTKECGPLPRPSVLDERGDDLGRKD